jgi:hypothetical protein
VFILSLGILLGGPHIWDSLKERKKYALLKANTPYWMAYPPWIRLRLKRKKDFEYKDFHNALYSQGKVHRMLYPICNDSKFYYQQLKKVRLHFSKYLKK